MKIFGIAGHSGMGKTTLLERLVPEIVARGLVVSLIKHSHKNIDIDRPGKDSYRLRESGCKEVLLLGNDRWALMHELRGAPEPSLDYLLERLQHCDLVLIEGFKNGAFPKLKSGVLHSASRCCGPTGRTSWRSPVISRWQRQNRLRWHRGWPSLTCRIRRQSPRSCSRTPARVRRSMSAISRRYSSFPCGGRLAVWRRAAG